ncbi:hypothetical protein QVO32_14185, partial [Bacteroides gallinaceum]|nr:hypothetical protein [Bacteroides gallinaceum]
LGLIRDLHPLANTHAEHTPTHTASQANEAVYVKTPIQVHPALVQNMVYKNQYFPLYHTKKAYF